MIGVKFIKTNDEISARLTGIVNGLNKFPQEATDKFKALTPIKTGNARRHTQLQNKTTIVADYPYVEPLDKGKSKQAPNGMTKPLEQWVHQRANDIMTKGK